MTLCGQWNEFNYYLVSNKCILGNNASVSLISGKTCPDTIIIPETVNNYTVEEIGKNSLSNLPFKELIILARITQINSGATWGCKNLEKVIIPNTCLYLFNSAIHVWDSSLGDDVSNPGITNVYFEPNSKIAFLDVQAICYRENMNIYFCNSVFPKIIQSAFNNVRNLMIHCPVYFDIGPIKSVQPIEVTFFQHNNSPLCEVIYLKTHCTCRYKNNGLLFLIVLIKM